MILLKPYVVHSITLECQPKVNPGILMQDCSTAELPIIASIPADWLFLHQWLKLGTAGPRKLEFNNSQLSETSWRSMFLSQMGERNSYCFLPSLSCLQTSRYLLSEAEEEISWISFFLWGKVLFPLLKSCHYIEMSVLTTWIFDGCYQQSKKKLSFIFVHRHCALTQLNWKIKIRFIPRDFFLKRLVTLTAVKSLLLKWDWQWLSRFHASPFIQLLDDFTRKWHWNPEQWNNSSQISQGRVLLLNRQLSVDLVVTSQQAMVFILHKMVSDALFLGRDGNVFCVKLGRTTFVRTYSEEYSFVRNRLKIFWELICWVNLWNCDV